MAIFSPASVGLTNPYKFSVFQNASQGSVGTADTRITFDNKDYDTNNNFDITTTKGTYTAPVAGFYHFSAFVFVQFAASTTSAYMLIYKNGSLYRRIAYQQATAVAYGMSGSLDMQLAATDTVDIRIGTSGAATTTASNTASSTFTGHLISGT